MSRPREIRARGIVKGMAAGAALISKQPISFLGDIDIATGEIVSELSGVRGRSLAGRVLVFPGSMGSAGAWRFIYQLRQHGTHPVALVCRDLPDPSVVQGAILASIPTVCAPEEDVLTTICHGDPLEVDGSGLIRVLEPGPELQR